MNLYGIDYSLYDLGFADPTLLESLSSSNTTIVDGRHREREVENLLKLSNSILEDSKRNSSPPKHRHDGYSPLPLGMDWSPPPRNWDGPNTIWPHDFHTGWSYCVTIPSWSSLSESEGSEPVVFYRVQVGLQSPEGVTATRGVLRRYSDFLNLSSDLKQSFRRKKFPPTPPKGLLRMRGSTLLEERRCSLEDWMAKVLSDIDISRSAPVACFLELEAAVRSSFCELSHHVADVNLSCKSGSSSDPFSSHSDVSVLAGTLALASNYSKVSTYGISEMGPALYVKGDSSESGNGNPISDNNLASLTEAVVNEALCEKNNATLSKEFSEGKEETYLHKLLDGRINSDKSHTGASYTVSQRRDSIENYAGVGKSPMDSHAEDLLRESPHKDASPATPNEISNLGEVHQFSDTSSKCSESTEASEALNTPAGSSLQFSHDKLVVLPMDEQQKMNRLLNTMQQRLVTSKTETEDLIARLDQEVSVRQYLARKVSDLETELESAKKSGKENLEQAIIVERERFTQMQWDMEELRRKGMDMEFRLKAEQDEKAHAEATKISIIKENEALRQELDSAREQLKNLQKCYQEAGLKSKSDVKLLVREVKSLRSSQSELQEELERVAKERTEFETRLQKERTNRECINAANEKLLHECEILRSRLEECSVNFLFEPENKLKMDASPPSNALDILATSENRIGLLLAEAQLLARDVTTPVTSSSHERENVMTTDDELRKMLTNVFIDNAFLRKQANSVMRCALTITDASHERAQTVKESAPSRKALMSKFFER